MCVTLALALTWSVAGAAPDEGGRAADNLAGLIELDGRLDSAFKIVEARYSPFNTEKGGWIILTLQARTDLDTGKFYCKMGFFDKASCLQAVSDLKFDSAFSLRKGESMRARGQLRDGLPQGQRIVVRCVEAPAPNSNLQRYHGDR